MMAVEVVWGAPGKRWNSPGKLARGSN